MRSVDQARVAFAASAQVQAASAGAGAALRFVGFPVNPDAQALADGMVSLLTLKGMDKALQKTPVPAEFKVGIPAIWNQRVGGHG